MPYLKLTAGMLVAGMLLLSGCGGGSDSSTPPKTEQPEPPSGSGTDAPPPSSQPSATITHRTQVVTTSGGAISVNVTTEGFLFPEFANKPVVLEFYGDSCPHCLEAIPTYNMLQSKYGNNVLILTINDGNQYTTLDNSGLQAFVAAHGMTYPTVSRENAGNLRSYAEELVGPMPGVPYVIIVNKEGVITQKLLGPDASQLEAAILDVL